MAQKIQTVIFNKEKWTEAEAKSWLADHDFKSGDVDETENSFRFRQFDPGDCAQDSFITLTENFPAGVSAVACEADSLDLSAGFQSRRPSNETRNFSVAELRIDGSAEAPKISGYAVVFDALSTPIEDMFGSFTETVRHGAFTRTLKTADVRGLWNHNPNFVLGRTKNDTLQLAEDDKGLKFELAPPNSQWSRDFQENVKRGDVDQMSFGFRTKKDRWTFDKKINAALRELLDVDLFDVSLATFPAYPQTSAEVRSAFKKFSRQQSHVSDFWIMRRQIDLAEKRTGRTG